VEGTVREVKRRVRVVASSYCAIDQSVTRWIVVTMVEWSSEVRCLTDTLISKYKHNHSLTLCGAINFSIVHLSFSGAVLRGGWSNCQSSVLPTFCLHV